MTEGEELKIKVAKALEPENVLAWLETKKGQYNYEASNDCAMAQFMKEKFPGVSMSAMPGYISLFHPDFSEGHYLNRRVHFSDVIENAVKPSFDYGTDDSAAIKTFEEAASDLRDALQEA